MVPGPMLVHVFTLQVAKHNITKASTLIMQVAVLQVPLRPEAR
jgi:hypothetical protein